MARIALDLTPLRTSRDFRLVFTATGVSGLGSFINSGTFSRSAGSSTTISTPFNNNGTVAVNAGSLSISGGGTDTGSYTSVPSG